MKDHPTTWREEKSPGWAGGVQDDDIQNFLGNWVDAGATNLKEKG